MLAGEGETGGVLENYYTITAKELGVTVEDLKDTTGNYGFELTEETTEETGAK